MLLEWYRATEERRRASNRSKIRAKKCQQSNRRFLLMEKAVWGQSWSYETALKRLFFFARVSVSTQDERGVSTGSWPKEREKQEKFDAKKRRRTTSGWTSCCYCRRFRSFYWSIVAILSGCHWYRSQFKALFEEAFLTNWPCRRHVLLVTVMLTLVSLLRSFCYK